MEGSYFNRLWAFKSRIRVVAASLYQSRETLRQRCRRWRNEIVRLRCQIQEQHREIVQRDQQIEESRVKLAELAARIQQLQKRPLVWPSDPRLPCHQYGPKMISLCIRLARRIGLRATPCCLTILFEHLGVRESIPDWTTIRQWMLRAGVALLEEPLERADDWILFVDHSNQIGQEKLLVIEGLRESQLPPPGHALTHEHLRVLTVQLGVSWKTEDMARVYEALAAKIGNPRALVIDGASELRDAAKVFQKGDSKTIILGDFKHFAANLLKKVLGRTERFQEFKQQMGTSRSTIQQTELGHFTPPGLKSKARFMNLQPTLKWALMILWQLAHPASRARQGISDARMNERNK